jgi:hypothetical protein
LIVKVKRDGGRQRAWGIGKDSGQRAGGRGKIADWRQAKPAEIIVRFCCGKRIN